MGREDYELARRELELARDGVRALRSNQGGEVIARLFESRSWSSTIRSSAER